MLWPLDSCGNGGSDLLGRFEWAYPAIVGAFCFRIAVGALCRSLLIFTQKAIADFDSCFARRARRPSRADL
jgi:hypothetical protein